MVTKWYGHLEANGKTSSTTIADTVENCQVRAGGAKADG